MPAFGAKLMCELRSPGELVGQAVEAERQGLDFVAISDHYHPWLEEQSHSPAAWPVLGAGERLNEHVVGTGWPPVDIRDEVLLHGSHVSVGIGTVAA